VATTQADTVQETSQSTVAPVAVVKGGHKSICGSPGSVPVSHLDYFGLTQIHGNTCNNTSTHEYTHITEEQQ
jgi:hypothetical protein